MVCGLLLGQVHIPHAVVIAKLDDSWMRSSIYIHQDTPILLQKKGVRLKHWFKLHVTFRISIHYTDIKSLFS